jgi:GAF domain-containing protein
MSLQASFNSELETHAYRAAEKLAVPFVTVQVQGDQNAHAHFIDEHWISAHPEIDISGLDSPNAAMTQKLPFFACVPIRDAAGQPVGSLCCGGSEARDLDDAELGLLRQIAAQITAGIDMPGQPRKAAQG